MRARLLLERLAQRAVADAGHVPGALGQAAGLEQDVMALAVGEHPDDHDLHHVAGRRRRRGPRARGDAVVDRLHGRARQAVALGKELGGRGARGDDLVDQRELEALERGLALLGAGLAAAVLEGGVERQRRVRARRCGGGAR